MSVVLQRMPLQTIVMNKLPVSPKRDDKMSTITMTQTSKRKKDYDQESDGFVFTKSKRAKSSREESAQPRRQSPQYPTRDVSVQPDEDITSQRQAKRPTVPLEKEHQDPPVRRSPVRSNRDAAVQRHARDGSTQAERRARQPSAQPESQSESQREVAKKRRLPTTPEQLVREPAKDRVPSPGKTVTVEKRRKTGTSRILLPASDTPIIRRNKAMRASVNERRRSSSGMRGRRASSMIDEGRWNAQPHAEVHPSDFYTMISSDLTEPRRMRLLLGWCGDRALPEKPQPASSSKQATEELQAALAARIIQEELSKDFSTNASLSEWFSRDTEAPQPIILHKRPNPRNILNAAKVEELEKELQRLRSERQAWEDLVSKAAQSEEAEDSSSSPDSALLSPSQQEILTQLRTSEVDQSSIECQLHEISSSVEFVVDQLSHSINAVTAATDVATRVADKSLSNAAKALKQRDGELDEQDPGPRVDALSALKGLARILNTQG